VGIPKGGIKMDERERRKIIEDIVLPTESVRQQVLAIFHDLTWAKRETQQYFLVAEITFVINKVWEGEDKPTMEEIEFYLDRAVAASPDTYKKHARMGYREYL